MRDLLNHEKDPDASDDHQINLHVLLTVRMAMMMIVIVMMLIAMVVTMVVTMVVIMVVIVMVLMVMASVVVTAPAKMRYCMEEHITEQASHCEREQDVCEAFTCPLVPHEAHIHCVDEEDRHD